MLTNIQKRAKHYWRIYGTMNNIVVVVALVIAASWAWGSVMVMQRNFALQKDADEQQRQLELTQLEVETLKYQQNYYSSDEYKDLAARTYLGLASPGEKVLILPPNSASVKDEAVRLATKPVVVTKNTARNNIDQWINFLAGNSALHLRE
jgi:cell division protein FtsB